VLNKGFSEGKKADLMLCMGSSLRVTPAADIPCETVEHGGQLVIINLQKTPLDKMAKLVIHAKIDDVVEILMEKLKLGIPKF
jgi:NAD-dependent SIR2 family protein deacetylase